MQDRGKWYVMLSVGAGLFLAKMDTSIVNIALPTLERVFDAEFALVQWVVLIYLLVTTALLLSIGRLADMVGRKTIYLLGYILFIIASALCGFAPSIGVLLLARGFQAVGAAMILALGLPIVTEAFPSNQRGLAIGVAGVAVSAGIVAGPPVGGVLIELLDWRWIFLVNVPIGIVGALLASRFVPASKPMGHQRFDFPGAGVFLLAMVALLAAMTLGDTFGLSVAAIIGLYAAAVLFLVWFIRIEQHSPHPMLRLAVFQNHDLTMGLVGCFLTFVIYNGVVFLLPFYLENVLGYAPLRAGLALAVLPISMGLVSPFAGRLSDRFGNFTINFAGLCLMALGFILFTNLHAGTSLLAFTLYCIPVGAGMGVFQAPNNSTVMGAATKDHLGIVGGLLAFARALGQTTGVAVLGALWASRVLADAGSGYSGAATDALAPAQVSGLQQTLLVVIMLMLVALALTAWHWSKNRQVVSQTVEPTA